MIVTTVITIFAHNDFNDFNDFHVLAMWFKCFKKPKTIGFCIYLFVCWIERRNEIIN